MAAIHCKAGLGRTGTVISSYFLYAGFITAPEVRRVATGSQVLRVEPVSNAAHRNRWSSLARRAPSLLEASRCPRSEGSPLVLALCAPVLSTFSSSSSSSTHTQWCRCVNYLHQILTQTKSLDVVHRPKRLVLKVRTRTRPAYARVWPMLINGGAIKQRIEMMPVPDVDMIKGGFWPVVELVDMHRFHSPFFLKKAHRYNTFFFIV